MSYKDELSGIDRDSEVSLTQQLVDVFRSAIDAGRLAPGEKLPPTRRLAEDAGVNHLTAARAYRRLAELGYVTATVGRGTFVRALAPAGSEELGDDWQAYALPDRPPTYQEEILADSFRFAGDREMISLATGFPSPDLFPAEEIAAFASEVFAEHGQAVLDYLNPEGLPELRTQIAKLGERVGFGSDPDEIIVTSGAQQSLDIVARSLVQAGDVVAIESPTFAGGLGAMRNTGARVLGVPVDEHGMDVDALEQLLQRHEIKACLLQTASHNPTGVDLSAERRQRLAELAVERNLFVVEDGTYGDTRFESGRPRALREQAPGHVIHVNSFSKVVGGGLRVGWIAARGPVWQRLATLKQSTDFHTATLTQHIAARYLASGAYERNRELARPYYTERRDAMVAALERHLAGEYRATPPLGGHHVWVDLLRPVDERTLYTEAVRQGVSFTPGGAVTAERRPRSSFRLSFSLVEPEQIDEGVRRLARALREVRRRDRLAVSAPLS